MSSDGGDVDGMSSCESETEVVEGVENQRGALHSSSDPPANLLSMNLRNEPVVNLRRRL